MVALFSPSGASAGFSLQFETRDFDRRTRAQLERDAVAISGASVDAVVATTRAVKERIRSHINLHFTGSAFTSNNNRRVANASAQERFYDDRAEKGQYTGLVYSKFGKRDRTGFTDYLLLHMRGGTIRPKTGEWLIMRNMQTQGALGAAQVTPRGYRSFSGSRIFMRPSKDGKKLFLLRELGSGITGRRRSAARGGLELLATLMKSVTIPASLTGIEAIVDAGGVEMQGRLSDLLDQRLPRGAR